MLTIRRSYFFIWALLLPLLFACRQSTLSALPTSAPSTRTVRTAVPASPQARDQATAPAPTDLPAPTPLPPAPPTEGEPAWPPALVPPEPFAPTPLTEAERRTAQALVAPPPVRDDLQLAREYGGVAPVPPALGPLNPPPLGSSARFNVLNNDSNTVVPITATLLAIGDHAYFWFDQAYTQPAQAALEPVAVAFDQIYESGILAFGSEKKPGIDGDERLHIVHASPAALCEDAARCGLAGYFSAHDALPRAVSASSNERDMFVMNGDKFGTDFYLNVLAHEFRHMIEDNYDPADLDWEVEGSAMLAEELAGFPANAHARGNAFLAEPDQQLNRWSDGNTYTRYGQGYVLNRYIYDRLGPELYRAFATNPADGLAAVTAVAAANDLALDGTSLWADWLAALALHRHPQAPARYRLGDGSLDTVAMADVDAFPATFATDVHQYAADYYRLHGERPLTLSFEGSRRVSLLDIAPPSGAHFWYAQRANYSQPRLTRELDLRPALSATLSYSVWHDIEYGYDFAYLSVSRDGQTWEPLVAPQMQGLVEADNPAGKALAERFYTGSSDGWLTEQVDLSAYAGQRIWIRFSYVTDPILTFGGLALDNISVPEIGFYDGAESGAGGWQAEGFARATATLPQEWLLQLITFPEGVPQVTALPIDESGRVEQEIALTEGRGEAILIVAARAPLTLEQAAYRLQIDD